MSRDPFLVVAIFVLVVSLGYFIAVLLSDAIPDVATSIATVIPDATSATGIFGIIIL